MGGTTSRYTLDLNAGLTQVLSDGTNTFLYGSKQFYQQAGGGKGYFLDDALGSVRQLADGSGLVTLSESYQPYREVLSSSGNGASSYGFTSEWADSTEFVYLRARYDAPDLSTSGIKDN